MSISTYTCPVYSLPSPNPLQGGSQGCQPSLKIFIRLCTLSVFTNVYVYTKNNSLLLELEVTLMQDALQQSVTHLGDLLGKLHMHHALRSVLERTELTEGIPELWRY